MAKLKIKGKNNNKLTLSDVELCAIYRLIGNHVVGDHEDVEHLSNIWGAIYGLGDSNNKIIINPYPTRGSVSLWLEEEKSNDKI